MSPFGACATLRLEFAGSYVTDPEPITEARSADLPPDRPVLILARLGLLAAVSVLLAGIFVGSFWITMRVVFAGSEVTVPDVVGLSPDKAQTALSAQELRFEQVAEKYDAAIPAGRVQSQEPEAGSPLKRNRKVKVVLSLGPLEHSVPDLAGQTLRTAELTLQREGLQIGHVTYTHDAKVAADMVMAQDPTPTPAQATPEERTRLSGWDGRVRLLVSRGPMERLFIMPDLGGRSIADVRVFAGRAGLRVGAVRRERSFGLASGLVIRQYPRAGSAVGPQDIISLVLSD